MVKLPTRDYAHVETVGIPRGLLYYRYGDLWTAFFEALGRRVVTSPETDRAIVEAGTLASVDECCLASKAYLGHVEWLIDRCDALFVPCYASGNPRAGFCTKFQSATDLVRNTFRARNITVMSLLVEDASDAKKTRNAFLELAVRMGNSIPEARSAWKQALHAHEKKAAERSRKQAETFERLDGERSRTAADGSTAAPLAILLVAHPYISHDRYLAGTVIDALERMGASVFYADETDRTRAFEKSFKFSDTLPWTINRELIGSILMLQDRIDGIVLVSAFPCGPDSMTDDAIMRCIQGTPILNLMIDAQSGTAGVETRIESFVDILRFQQKGGYIRD